MSRSSMAAVLVVLIVVRAGGLSQPCAASGGGGGETSGCAATSGGARGGALGGGGGVRLFLQSCCDTLLPDRSASGFCYDELLPYAESFEGNQVKVADAAAIILAIKLRAFLDEMRKVQGGDGNGDSNLASCVEGLAAAGDGKRSKEDLENVQKWIKDADNNFNGGTACELNYLFEYSDDLPTKKILADYLNTASSLINDISI